MLLGSMPPGGLLKEHVNNQSAVCYSSMTYVPLWDKPYMNSDFRRTNNSKNRIFDSSQSKN